MAGRDCLECLFKESSFTAGQAGLGDGRRLGRVPDGARNCGRACRKDCPALAGVGAETATTRGLTPVRKVSSLTGSAWSPWADRGRRVRRYFIS